MSDDSEELRELRGAVAKLAEIMADLLLRQHIDVSQGGFPALAKSIDQQREEARAIARQFSEPQEQP